MSLLDFSFLGQRAGFQIAESLWAVTAEDPYWQLMVAGVINTLTIAAIAIPLATGLGLLLGILRLTRHPLLARALVAVIEPIRNTPVLLQMFMWYALLLQLPWCAKPGSRCRASISPTVVWPCRCWKGVHGGLYGCCCLRQPCGIGGARGASSGRGWR